MADVRRTMPGLAAMKAAGERLVMLTCYDALMARLLDAAGIDLLLVGDSVNEVLAGRRSTLSATLDQMIYHAASVRRGTARALVVVDLPFLSYQVSIASAIRNAGRVMAETECEAVKLEGGGEMAPTVRALVSRGIPVIGHLGFTPQSIHRLGGPRVQGRTAAVAAQLRTDAIALQDAGASAIVLELVPQQLAAEISAACTIPTIGIGSGAGCDGQVLVLHDMLGLNEAFTPKFLRRYADLGAVVREAAGQYAADVRAGTWPDAGHAFD
ncbi:MAG TPA: 3-methyl-2-oxobutanoate hydroxymethyltransferase [Gemmatimonadales bacterium]|nr:3-methyl-2-oxobutanoate hydroxymethyltransferase [Gemmatimonadales bacterium]